MLVSMNSVGCISGRVARRTARLLVGPAALGLAVFGGSAALAAPAYAYGPTPAPAVVINVSVVSAGGTITLSGTFGNQGDTLEFTLHSTPVVLGTTIAGVNGAYSVTLTIPSSTTPGTHTITISDLQTGASATSPTFTVLGASNSTGGLSTSGFSSTSNRGSGGLAFTGTYVAATTAVGAGAIGLGGVIVLSSRKRRRNSFTS